MLVKDIFKELNREWVLELFNKAQNENWILGNLCLVDATSGSKEQLIHIIRLHDNFTLHMTMGVKDGITLRRTFAVFRLSRKTLMVIILEKPFK